MTTKEDTMTTTTDQAINDAVRQQMRIREQEILAPFHVLCDQMHADPDMGMDEAARRLAVLL